MTTTAAGPGATGTADLAATATRFRPWMILVAGVVVLQVVFGALFGTDGFPAIADLWLEEPIDRAGSWMRSNRRSHPLFTGFFSPLSSGIGGAIEALSDALVWLPWFALIALAVLPAVAKRLWTRAAVIAVALLYCGAIGLWVESMETLALMAIAVLLAVLVGLPLGVLAALRPRVETAIRPVLDAMQTIPAFVYFLPLFMVFGIGNVPAVVATVIYALPPVVRLTTLGIRRVPTAAVEASTMFGASTRQTLTKVQLPMALNTIMTGLSQTIMMALGIVVLATLVGADGLGSPVLESLNQRRTGRGIAAGLAIVAVAMVLDRIWQALAHRDPTARLDRQMRLGAVGVVVALVALGRAVGASGFPEIADWTLFDPIDSAVVWVRDNLRWLTRPFSDFIVGWIYIPVRDFLVETAAWPVVVFVAGWLGWAVKGWRLAAFCAGSVLVMGLIGMWELSIDTLIQVLIATVLAVAVAIPIGVWAGRRPRVEAAMSPVLDALQTIPSLVYIIPAVIFFTVGVVPGIIATVLYAMVPGVRITALGIKEVAAESIEASEMFGATPRQTLFGVRIPLAAPTIMMGVNQVIMMVLAMVIITGLVGSGALGFEVVRSLQRSLFGLGFEVGLALVLMAMVLDRLTEAAANRLRPPTQNLG